MERSVEVFAVIHLVTMGLSHVLAPKAWVEFFVALRERGHTGVFAAGFISLFFGSIIAAFHDVWSGPGLVLTLVGWGQVAKGALYFLFPAYGLRGLGLVDRKKPGAFIAAGIGLLLVAGTVVYGWL